MMAKLLPRLGTALSRSWGILLLLLCWDLWVRLGNLNAIVMPSPAGVLADLVGNPRLYWLNGGVTLLVALAGLSVGLIVGTTIAVAAWASRVLGGMLLPIAMTFTSIPVVATIPILARVLGYNVRTTIAIVALFSFFTVFVFVSAGLRKLPAGSQDLFRVLGAGKWTMLVRLALPAALPNLMIAFRLAATQAVLAAMLAEFFMGGIGLGYQFRFSSGQFNTERAFGMTAVATAVSLVAFSLAAWAERATRERWT